MSGGIIWLVFVGLWIIGMIVEELKAFFWYKKHYGYSWKQYRHHMKDDTGYEG